MMKLLKSIIASFKKQPEPIKKQPEPIKKQPEPKKAHLMHVKKGDHILIEWERINGGTGWMECKLNDPETNRIVLVIEWGNYKEVKGVQFETFVMKYSDKRLANFDVLNPEFTGVPNEINVKRNEIKVLTEQMKEHERKQEFEQAAKVRDKINELKKAQ